MIQCYDAANGSDFVVAQIGARQHYAVPQTFHAAGRLQLLYTDLCTEWRPLSLALRIPGARDSRYVKRMSGRRSGLPTAKVRCFPGFAVARTWARRQPALQQDPYRRFLDANKTFCQLVCRAGLPRASAVYVFQGAGLEIMEAARSQGMRIYSDQVIAPVAPREQLLFEEREIWRGWDVEGQEDTSWSEMSERQAREWELADRLLCGSDYVSQGLQSCGVAADKCRVVPYGAVRPAISPPRTPSGEQRPLNVLFAGTLCLRKGIQYLYQTASKMDKNTVRFRAVGGVELTEKARNQVAQHIELVPPVSRAAMAEQYAWSDVMVLPTLAEGSALVCYEALAHGVPVITTPNAGSVVRDGVDGYIVPIRDPDTIADRLATLAADRSLLAEMSSAVASRAADFTWDRYSERLLQAVQY